MKKILVVLGGIVFLTGSSYSQMTNDYTGPTNIGAVLSITNTYPAPGESWGGTVDGSYTNMGNTIMWPSYASGYGIPTEVPMLMFEDALGSRIVFWNDNGKLRPADFTRKYMYEDQVRETRIYFRSNGTVFMGFTNIVNTYGISWDGGGMGPGYVPAEVLNKCKNMSVGLRFQNGRWSPED